MKRQQKRTLEFLALDRLDVVCSVHLGAVASRCKCNVFRPSENVSYARLARWMSSILEVKSELLRPLCDVICLAS